MVNYLNETEYGHILTVEGRSSSCTNPKCLINQREVGPMTLSFAAALKSALREDPDAILVGEMRDLETIRLAMTAAETGPWCSARCTPPAPPRPSTGSLTCSGRRKGNGARDAVRIAAGRDLANPVQNQGRLGPCGCARNHAGHQRHPQP